MNDTVLQGRALMAPYLPQDRVAPSPYSEGGALYALGLIHANHGQDIRQFILQCLRDTSEEVRVLSLSILPLSILLTSTSSQYE